MILYTCNQKDHGPHQLHPCGKAGHALKEAGYEKYLPLFETAAAKK